MDDLRCPRCGLISPAGTGHCDCGWNFVSGVTELFRMGGLVVVGNHGTLPARCVKCNAPADGSPITLNLVDSDAPGGAPHGVIGTAVHLRTRRTAKVFIHLCDRHRRARQFSGLAGGTLLAVAALLMAACVFGFYEELTGRRPGQSVAWVSVALWGVGAALYAIRYHYVHGRIHGQRVWLKGAGREFLASLPDE